MENNNTKNMKKFRKPLVIVAMVLMVALVVGMGAMTYSRYISTTDVPEQTATAAQWGFVVTANTSELFGDAYNYDTGVSKINPNYGASGLNIKANAENKLIVAPGATGSMSITIDGKAEVLAKLGIKLQKAGSDPLEVTSSTTEDQINAYISDIAFDTYAPIKWTLKNGASTLVEDGTLAAAIKAIGQNAGTIEPNTTKEDAYELSWEWTFTVDGATDTKDTIIGLVSSWRALDASAQTATPINTYVNRGLGLEDGDETYTVETLNAISTAISFNLIITVEQIQATP